MLSAILGGIIGAVLGLTGAGGGILAVPALAFSMNWSMQQAAPVALIAIAIAAAVGTIEGLRKGLVRYKAACLIAVSGLPFIYMGQQLAGHMSQAVLQLTFALVMGVVAFRMNRQSKVIHTTEPVESKIQETVKTDGVDGIDGIDEKREAIGEADPIPEQEPSASTEKEWDLELGTHQADHELPAVKKAHRLLAQVNESGRFIWNAQTAIIMIFIGSLTGFMGGLLGVGGGFVIVPMLRKFTAVSMQGVVATSLMVIALVGIGGVASAIVHSTPILWGAAATFTVATVAGMFIGRRLVKRLTSGKVQTVFSIVLAAVAFGMFAKAGTSLMKPKEPIKQPEQRIEVEAPKKTETNQPCTRNCKKAEPSQKKPKNEAKKSTKKAGEPKA